MRHQRIQSALIAAGFCFASAFAASANAQSTAGAQKVQSNSSESCTNPKPGGKKLSDMVVGFSQSENEQNPFRATETASVRAAAKEAGVKRLLYTNANANQAKQVADIESMINQGAEALIIAPNDSTGLQPALAQARAKGIPVVTIDRQTAGTVCDDFITFLGSDFYKQGERAAKALADATGGNAVIAEIQGGYGNTVESQRTDGFANGLKPYPGMKIIAAQTANWSTTEAQKVMEQILLAHPDVNAVYTHADTMTVGAIKALRQAGKLNGVKIVSIDGTKEIVSDISNGIVAADVETNPRFGPLAFKSLEDYLAGKPVPQKQIMDDALFDRSNAQPSLAQGKVY
ncbi:ABC transporter substrate-binding protein [Paraburkholderia guartelaensis]|uniref:ABC transporter substrate-binding protein n=1 Tax=Paraburkholderia guartelaensis TaxID=2546446 RepID=A0A4V2ZV19_9BURK|nr:ABC transporter substrate-binding protein [Paraburkholderia guartelaensis]TDG02949.1 ABC transporter substrate-binding protein [Paraburkholderia guartelaensis]